MKTETAFIDRPIFTQVEAKAVLMAAAQTAVPVEGEQLLSPRDVLDFVATALRDAFVEVAFEQFEEVTAYAIS